MDILAILEILKIIGGGLGAIVTIGGFIAIVLKKPKAWFQKIAHEEVVKAIQEEDIKDREQFEEIKTLLKGINEKMEIRREATLASLRHEITEIFDTYYCLGYLPQNVRKDLISLYEAYTKCGGNSYVKNLYDLLIILPPQRKKNTEEDETL